MFRKKRTIFTTLLATGVLLSGGASRALTPPDEAVFGGVPDAAKVHAWWHWISGNINKEGITRDLESMNVRGVSQLTILNVGSFVSADLGLPNVKFGSPEWYEMFRFSLEEANRLGMKVGVHNCDGWSTSGGPWVKPEQSMKEYVWSKTKVSGGKQVGVQLPLPPNQYDYYEDAVVLAYPTIGKDNAFRVAGPEVNLGEKPIGDALMDGNPLTKTEFTSRKAITIVFDEPYEAEQLVVLPHLVFAWTKVSETPVDLILSSSQDGEEFTEISKLELVGVNRVHTVEIPKTTAKFFKVESEDLRNPFSIAEFELLPSGEVPSYSTKIRGLLQKAVSVKTSDSGLYEPTQKDPSTVLKRSEVLDITEHLDPESGKLMWQAPEGEWTVLRFGYTTTGFKNKPATPEGLGLDIDKMDPMAAKMHFDAFTGKLIETAGEMTGDVFTFTLIDSWECLYQNWTHRFGEEFAQRRGYDIIPWIPVLCGEVVESTKLSDGFLHDFRKTIADLIGENYYKAWADLCHANGLEMHAEAIYGGGAYPPLDILKANGYADLPMLEFWARPDKVTFLPTYKPAQTPEETFPSLSSLAYDKPVIGSEAYTNRSYYSESPGDLKQHGDAAYCAGVNQMILHSSVHQPIEDKPGVTLGQFGAPFNRNNPWWKHSTDWLTYQARAQYLLQMGEPVVDVVFYVGDHYPQERGNLVPKGIPDGFRGGACNFEMLVDRASVNDGKISFGGLQEFAFLILPDRTSMELETLKVIDRLIEKGAVVYGPRPEMMLGASEIENRQDEFDALVSKLWDDPDSESNTGNSTAKGVVADESIEDLVKKEGLQPDFAASNATPRELMYTHRKTEGEDIYFVFNQTDKPIRTELMFRVEGKSPEVWQAETGMTMLQPVFSREDGVVRMPMEFDPRQSYFFVFRDEYERPHVTRVTKGGKALFPAHGKLDEPVPVATFERESIGFRSQSGGVYTFSLSNGEKLERELAKPEVIDVGQGGANVSFEPIYDEEIQPITMKNLKSITENEDPSIKYFAGTLRYTLSFNVSDALLKEGAQAELNFGKVDATAEVKLNGSPIGEIWAQGTTIPVENLVAGENILEVAVATTCRNRLIGDLKIYGEVQTVFTAAPIDRLLDKIMPLKPTGLLGPVRLTIHP